jgi:hypothetical protein
MNFSPAHPYYNYTPALQHTSHSPKAVAPTVFSNYGLHNVKKAPSAGLLNGDGPRYLGFGQAITATRLNVLA